MNPDDILDQFKDWIEAHDGREIPDDIAMMEAIAAEIVRLQADLAAAQEEIRQYGLATTKLKDELIAAQEALRQAQPLLDELARAEAKFPTWPTDVIHAAAVVGEESGELQQAALQATYEGGTLEHCRREAIQTGAMALRFLLHLPLLETRRSSQRPRPDAALRASGGDQPGASAVQSRGCACPCHGTCEESKACEAAEVRVRQAGGDQGGGDRG